jgi:hypothetical protein
MAKRKTRASIRSMSSAFSRLSTPRRPAGWGWGCRSAGPLLTPTVAGCGRMRMNREAPYFGSLCPARKVSSRIESRAKAPFQPPVVNWFAKITSPADDAEWNRGAYPRSERAAAMPAQQSMRDVEADASRQSLTARLFNMPGVLPFQNMSGDLEQEYFTDGVVEDIISALSRKRWLFVIARNSTFTYKGVAESDAKRQIQVLCSKTQLRPGTHSTEGIAD